MTIDLSGVASGGVFVGGDWRPGGRGEFDDITPCDGSVFASAPDGDAADMAAAVAAARHAFDDGPWPRLSAAERSACLRQLSEALVRHESLFAEMARLEWGTANDVYAQVSAGAYVAARNAEDLLAIEHLAVSGADGSSGSIVHVPEGVVAAATPWNYPHVLNLMKITSAIATGNTMVLKPSPLTPLAALAVAHVIDQQTDIPPGVVNVVPTSSVEVARALTDEPGVDMISFTGSTTVGKQIAAGAAATLKRLVLELGGKSAAIHLDDLTDADYDTLAPRTLFEGCTRHSGQACILTSRLLVPARREREIVDRLVALAEAVSVGDPRIGSDMGPMISRAQADSVLRQVREAVATGAQLATGGDYIPGAGDGAYLAPTILRNVHSDMPVAQNELFGPVLVVIPYDSLEQAITIANATRYGLVASVTGADVDLAERVGRRMRASQVMVNGAMPLGPFGGFGESGLGREQGVAGLLAYTETQTVSRPEASEPTPR